MTFFVAKDLTAGGLGGARFSLYNLQHEARVLFYALANCQTPFLVWISF